MKWRHEDAVELCRLVETVAPTYGCHVALTGGTLYKSGERKDADILFYRIRQRDSIDQAGLFDALEAELGISKLNGFGWCHKLVDREGRKIDAFFPECEGEEYPADDELLT